MPNFFTPHVILDGTVKTILKIDILGDGISGDETGKIIYDPATYINKGISKRLIELHYVLNGFSANLLWGDAGTGQPLVVLEKDNYSHPKYNCFGGIPNNVVVGRTGKILIATHSLGSNYGYIILHLESLDSMPGVP